MKSFQSQEGMMLITLEIDSDFFAGDNIALLEAVDKAYREIVTKAEQISPVLSRYLQEVRCICTHPGHSDPKIEFVIPLSLPRATCSARFEYTGTPSGERKIFSQPSATDIINAFIGSENGRQPETFWRSRLGEAFLWGIKAGRRNDKEDAAQRRELEKAAGL